MEYRIIRYGPALRDQVLELQTHLWSSDTHVNSQYLDWKYESNPYLGEPLIYLALWGQKVVGMRGVYGACWQAGRRAQRFAVPCGGDTVVHPQHRGRRLFQKIQTFALDDLAKLGYSYVFNFSASWATVSLSLRSGWRGVGPYHSACWQTARGRVFRWLGSHLKKRVPMRVHLAYPDLSRVLRQWRVWAQRPPSDPFAGVAKPSGSAVPAPLSVEKQPWPAAMSKLVRRIGTDGRVRHLRDETYFAWRYRNPLCSYRFFFWSADELEGYLVLQALRQAKRRAVAIVDWEATTTEILQGLLEAVIRIGKFESITIWTSTLPEPVTTLLRHVGFQDVDAPHRKGHPSPGPMVRAVDGTRPESEWALGDRHLLDLKNWDLRMVCSDFF